MTGDPPMTAPSRRIAAFAIAYFAIIGRHKLILSPEEEFAIAHANGGGGPGTEEPAPAE